MNKVVEQIKKAIAIEIKEYFDYVDIDEYYPKEDDFDLEIQKV